MYTNFDKAVNVLNILLFGQTKNNSPEDLISGITRAFHHGTFLYHDSKFLSVYMVIVLFAFCEIWTKLMFLILKIQLWRRKVWPLTNNGFSYDTFVDGFIWSHRSRKYAVLLANYFPGGYKKLMMQKYNIGSHRFRSVHCNLPAFLWIESSFVRSCFRITVSINVKPIKVIVDVSEDFIASMTFLPTKYSWS